MAQSASSARVSAVSIRIPASWGVAMGAIQAASPLAF